MMMQESSIAKQDFIFLMQSGNRNLEQQLLKSVAGQNIRLLSIESFDDVKEQRPRGKIVTFIVGSDADDPVQSAQRFHALEKNAKIILLAKSEKEANFLKEAIRFSPFIGMNVFCLDESSESVLEKLKNILEESLKAEKYRAIIRETNAQISTSVSYHKQAFNQQFINKLMDIAPVGIAIVNRQGKVLGWNKEAASIFQKDEEQVLGTSLSQLFEHSEGKRLENYFSNGFENTNGNGRIESLELERETKDTSRQILNFTASLFSYSEEPEKVLILAIKDITERKLAEAKLRELNYSLEQQAKKLASSNAELEQFAFVASHDLQEPLRMITGFLAQIEKKYDSVLDEKGKKYIHFAADGARRMRQIILDLLEFSRAGRIDIDRVKVDLNELFKEVLSLNKKLISEKKAEVKFDELPVITAAKGPMHQLFQNLINNAIKYQKKDSKPVVEVTWEEDEQYWHFKVRDNGIGFKQEYSEKIFTIFQRLHGKDEYSGTGVGLAICKKIVEDHGGKITAESREGKGSIFYFTISKNIDSEKAVSQL